MAERADATMRALIALRVLGDAFDRMYAELERDMDMNVTDVRALRLLIEAEQRDERLSPHDLARGLRISTASTTKLLDRLSAGGYVERLPHPSDRRALLVALTEHSRASFYRHFGEHLQTMREVASAHTVPELEAATAFMERIAERLARD